MIIRDGDGVFSHIKCDDVNCEERSAGTGFQAEGLIQRGWFCSGGKHLCPMHKDQGGDTRVPGHQ